MFRMCIDMLLARKMLESGRNERKRGEQMSLRVSALCCRHLVERRAACGPLDAHRSRLCHGSPCCVSLGNHACERSTRSRRVGTCCLLSSLCATRSRSALFLLPRFSTLLCSTLFHCRRMLPAAVSQRLPDDHPDAKVLRAFDLDATYGPCLGTSGLAAVEGSRDRELAESRSFSRIASWCCCCCCRCLLQPLCCSCSCGSCSSSSLSNTTRHDVRLTDTA